MRGLPAEESEAGALPVEVVEKVAAESSDGGWIIDEASVLGGAVDALAVSVPCSAERYPECERCEALGEDGCSDEGWQTSSPSSLVPPLWTQPAAEPTDEVSLAGPLRLLLWTPVAKEASDEGDDCALGPTRSNEDACARSEPSAGGLFD